MQMLIIALVLCLLSLTASTEWDFAVTTDSRIVFYNSEWQEVFAAAHQFDQLSALTFDETEEIIYFNDRKHNNGSIFSLKLPTASNTQPSIDKIVHRTQNESVMGLTYDPLTRNIFWTDQQNKKIYFISIDAEKAQEPKTLFDFQNETTMPYGIAMDICRRKLYFTNSNFHKATVERVDLDGTNREVIIRSDLFFPHGIVVDQFSERIYYVVKKQGVFFSVESAKLDGSDRRVVVNGSNSIEPRNIAVTENTVFWTDKTYNAVWGHPKTHAKGIQFSDLEGGPPSQQPNKVLTFKNEPRGIIARSGFLTTMMYDASCSDTVRKIKNRLLNRAPTKDSINTELDKFEREYCLNSGEFIKQSGVCICKLGYKGRRCGTYECHNFCVHGTCSISSMGVPKCACPPGYYGDRCQLYKCTGYCFNGGDCSLDIDDEPSCQCQDNFGGQRCEQNSTEICSLFCRILKHEPEVNVPFGCHDICEKLAQRSENGDIYAIPQYQHLQVCRNGVQWNTTVVTVLVCGTVISLFIVAIIVHGLRRFYKPARPRIKKTFVVRKQAAVTSSDTPLTNRPLATEQCEITIENCCNMNICDTPCFDPRLVQQSMSEDNNAKDDKKMLIHNMEDELY